MTVQAKTGPRKGDIFLPVRGGPTVQEDRCQTGARTDGLDFTFADIDWFRAEAARRSVRIDPELEIVLRNLEPVAKWTDSEESPKRWDPNLIIDAAGTAHLLRTVRRVQQISPTLAAAVWSRVGAHARLVLPMRRTDRGNKLWEVVVAAAASAHFDDVRLAEPDVTCLFGSQVWGIACKVVHSTRKDTQLARIIDGMDQIESSNVSHGIVVVNVTKLIPHPVYLGTFRHPVSAKVINDALRLHTRQIADRVHDAQLVDRIRRWKSGRTRQKYQGVVFFAQCLAASDRGVRVFGAQQSRSVFNLAHDGLRFANRLHLGFQRL